MKKNVILLFVLLVFFFQTHTKAYSENNPTVKTIHYFSFGDNCPTCKKIENQLKNIKGFNHSFIIKIYDTNKRIGIFKLTKILEEKLKVKISEFPAVVLGEYVCQGSDEILKNINKIDDLIQSPKPIYDFLADSKLDGDIVDYNKYILNKLNLTVVITTAFLDSINPCAIITFFLLLSYFGSISKQKNILLFASTIFISTIYITYYLVGVGIFAGIKSLLAISLFEVILKTIILCVIFLFAIINLIDCFMSKQKDNQRDFRFFNKIIKTKYEKIFSENSKNIQQGKLILIFTSLIILGFFITIIELGCTGQIYFPLITYLTRQNYLQGYYYLALYNFIFISPLIVLAIIVYCGIKIPNFNKFFTKYKKEIKLIYSILLLIIAVLQGYYWFG